MDQLRYPQNSHEVNVEGQAQVLAIARIMNAHPTLHIEIRGHSDGVESEIYTGPMAHDGYPLSKLRADCIFRRLVVQKVARERMTFSGAAAADPVADDRTAEGQQQNRRIEIIVLKR